MKAERRSADRNRKHKEGEVNCVIDKNNVLCYHAIE